MTPTVITQSPQAGRSRLCTSFASWSPAVGGSRSLPCLPLRRSRSRRPGRQALPPRTPSPTVAASAPMPPTSARSPHPSTETSSASPRPPPTWRRCSSRAPPCSCSTPTATLRQAARSGTWRSSSTSRRSAQPSFAGAATTTSRPRRRPTPRESSPVPGRWILFHKANFGEIDGFDFAVALGRGEIEENRFDRAPDAGLWSFRFAAPQPAPQAITIERMSASFTPAQPRAGKRSPWRG